ncbi:hypothetical protein R3P38DRAFT_3190351 [Favolaschia claudopus]|uniref:Uncharacterized protein n=1 Tax=Favolaschia claudopus TaxID=2862362 RepID=A0AAW0BQ70_9AGAR
MFSSASVLRVLIRGHEYLRQFVAPLPAGLEDMALIQLCLHAPQFFCFPLHVRSGLDELELLQTRARIAYPRFVSKLLLLLFSSPFPPPLLIPVLILILGSRLPPRLRADRDVCTLLVSPPPRGQCPPDDADANVVKILPLLPRSYPPSSAIRPRATETQKRRPKTHRPPRMYGHHDLQELIQLLSECVREEGGGRRSPQLRLRLRLRLTALCRRRRRRWDESRMRTYNVGIPLRWYLYEAKVFLGGPTRPRPTFTRRCGAPKVLDMAAVSKGWGEGRWMARVYVGVCVVEVDGESEVVVEAPRWRKVMRKRIEWQAREKVPRRRRTTTTNPPSAPLGNIHAAQTNARYSEALPPRGDPPVPCCSSPPSRRTHPPPPPAPAPAPLLLIATSPLHRHRHGVALLLGSSFSASRSSSSASRSFLPLLILHLHPLPTTCLLLFRHQVFSLITFPPPHSSSSPRTSAMAYADIYPAPHDIPPVAAHLGRAGAWGAWAVVTRRVGGWMVEGEGRGVVGVSGVYDRGRFVRG